MHFIRLSLIGLFAVALCSNADAQGGGANRLVTVTGNGTWTTTSDNLLPPVAVNGFNMAVTGDFGFGDGDEIYLLARNGANRFVIRTSDGKWTTAQGASIDPVAVNGFDMAVAGDFGFGDGDEMYLLARNGANRFLIRTSDGKWTTAQGASIDPVAVNGFDMAVAGDFGFGDGDEIFLLARNGANRLLIRPSDGKWTTAQGISVNTRAVNGYDLSVAGDFGFGKGDEIFLLATSGANRFVFRDPSDAWTTTTGDVLNPKAVNGYSKVVSGVFGDGPESGIFLLD